MKNPVLNTIRKILKFKNHTTIPEISSYKKKQKLKKRIKARA